MKESFRSTVLRYSALAILFWSTILGVSLAWNISNEQQQSYDLALQAAQANFNKDLAFRLWGTKHGGVYVPPTEKTPPSPWMAHLPERDIEATTGKKLTLMNPAYMIRQMMDDYTELYGITGRIVGLKALNPNNLADPWEAVAINLFIEKKAAEVIEVTEYKGKPHLRLIRPFMMTAGCVKCHAILGYKDGDVRGAVGVSLPMEPYIEIGKKGIMDMIFSHAIIYLLGLLGIAIIAYKAHGNLRQRKQSSDQLSALNAELTLLNEHLESQVEKRTSDLSNSLDNLKKAQKHIIESEKMASLGGLVAGVAHEVNTPVGVGVTAASTLKELAETFQSRFETEPLKKNDFRNFIASVVEASNILLPNLNRAADLVRSFKQIAVDQSDAHYRDFEVREYLDEIMVSLRPRFKQTNHAIEINCSKEWVLNGNPGHFAQVITNLFMNSLKHAYEDGQAGHIGLDVSRADDRLVFHYHDDGKGIAPEHLGRIFEPFFTTARGKGGSGLGLSTVYNIVTQQMGGEVRCESNIGKGTSFYIRVPFRFVEVDADVADKPKNEG